MKKVLKEIKIILITIIIIAIPFYYYKFVKTPYIWLFTIAFYADVSSILRLVKFYFKHKDDKELDE